MAWWLRGGERSQARLLKVGEETSKTVRGGDVSAMSGAPGDTSSIPLTKDHGLDAMEDTMLLRWVVEARKAGASAQGGGEGH